MSAHHPTPAQPSPGFDAHRAQLDALRALIAPPATTRPAPSTVREVRA